MGSPPQPPIDRFWAKVERGPIAECWTWKAGTFKTGYGSFFPGCRAAGSVLAHRWAYEHFRGPIPSGLELDHLCRNRRCVNPAHLETVTRMENMRRSPLMPMNRTHCPRGHPYNSENTRIGQNRNYVYRRCATCRAIGRGRPDPGPGQAFVMSRRAAPRRTDRQHRDHRDAT